MVLALALVICSALTVSTLGVIELTTSNETSVERDALVLRVEAAAEGGMNAGASVLAANPAATGPIEGEVDAIPFTALVKALPDGWLVRSDVDFEGVRRSVSQQFEMTADGLRAVAGSWRAISSSD